MAERLLKLRMPNHAKPALHNHRHLTLIVTAYDCRPLFLKKKQKQQRRLVRVVVL